MQDLTIKNMQKLKTITDKTVPTGTGKNGGSIPAKKDVKTNKPATSYK